MLKTSDLDKEIGIKTHKRLKFEFRKLLSTTFRNIERKKTII